MTGRCLVCTAPLSAAELRTCLTCLSEVRGGLLRLERLFAELPSLFANLGAASALDSVLARGGDDATLPGGDVLVMLGPGSSSHAGSPTDPPAVTFELWSWAGDWCEVRREDPAKVPTGVPALADWLSVRAGWAADHHPAFDEFASDVRRIVVRLEDVTGRSDRPEKGPPCPYCRASLLREWTDAGLSDDWVCTRCRRAFNPPQYRLAVMASLADEQERAQA